MIRSFNGQWLHHNPLHATLGWKSRPWWYVRYLLSMQGTSLRVWRDGMIMRFPWPVGAIRISPTHVRVIPPMSPTPNTQPSDRHIRPTRAFRKQKTTWLGTLLKNQRSLRHMDASADHASPPPGTEEWLLVCIFSVALLVFYIIMYVLLPAYERNSH